MSQQTAITPTRAQDFPEWYQQVIKAADMAENSEVRGCMVIKPWGYAIWELIQKDLDQRFKDTGHTNAYFPLLIPISYLEKEAEHAEGFATECAVVTHHRLEAQKDEATGKTRMIPTGELTEPFVIRPTSETVIGAAFARWTSSYRDLPLKVNQWCNVMRWEMRPRIFLRTAEFLWQEGHTAHETREEAIEETLTMHKVYEDFQRDVLAIPTIPGEKTEAERFPGAEQTYTVEAMVQDRKAIQAGTSHFLGQNFSKSQNICFAGRDNTQQFAWTSSWGVSTRMIDLRQRQNIGRRFCPKVQRHFIGKRLHEFDGFIHVRFFVAGESLLFKHFLYFGFLPIELVGILPLTAVMFFMG